MKRKKYKKTIVFLAMLTSVTTCFSACSTKQVEKQNTEKQTKTDKDISNVKHNKEEKIVYQGDFQTVKEKLELIHEIFTDEKHVFILGSVYEKAKGEKKERYHTYFLSCQKDGSNIEKTEIHLDQTASIHFASINCSKNGKINIYIITSGDTIGDNKYKSNTGYYFHTIDTQGNIIESHGLNLNTNDNFYISTKMSFVTEDNFFYTVVGQRVYGFDAEGKQSSVSIFNEQDIYGLVPITNETVFVLGKSAGAGSVWKLLDLKDGKFGELNRMKDYDFTSITIRSANENNIFLEDSKNMYKLDIENGEIQLLFSWLSLGIDDSSFLHYDVNAKGEITAVTTKKDHNNIVPELILIKEKTSSNAEKEIISLACIFEPNTSIKEKLIEFNKTNKHIQIELLDYSGYGDSATKMNLDIVSGNIPDIICTQNLPVQQYIKKGIFTDLYPFMEKDNEIKKEDFIDSVISAVETDGKLYHFSSAFSISALAGSKKILGDRTSWTIEEMEEIYNKMPEDSVFMQGQKRQWFLWEYLSTQMQDYVNWQTGEVKFDSDEFKHILEFSKNFPDQKEDIPKKYDRITAIKQGKVMLEHFQFYDFSDIQVFTELYKSVGGFTILPYPSMESRDTLPMDFSSTSFGITEQCSNKEIAWKFLRQFLTYDYQKSLSIDESDGYPTRKDALEKRLEYAQAQKKYKDNDGTVVKPIQGSFGFEGVKIKLDPLTKKEVNTIRETIDRVGTYSSYNEGVKQIIDIVMEEVESYYVGDKTAEEIIEIIQNRVKIYISENS